MSLVIKMILWHTVLAIIFVNIITVSCDQKGSLSFVIDDTLSMKDDIDQVTDAADRIMDIVLQKNKSQIQDIVLVTFNDPVGLTKLRMKTRDKQELSRALHQIRVGGGGDCPEYSLTGIQMALDNSFPNSYLFVFTDATPKDKSKTNKIKSLAQSKQSQIVFILTPTSIPYCRRYDDRNNFKYYYDIASSTFGQVFMLDDKKQVNQILHYVDTVVSGDKTTIVSVPDIPPNTLTYVPFTIDDQTEYVIVSSSGTDVELDITDGPTREYEKITWIRNAKVLKINNPDPGNYKAAVRGSASTSVMVFGRTDFKFQHGFSEIESSKFNNDTKQPTDGKRYHLLISVIDPAHSVNIETAEILDKGGNLLQTLPLRHKSGDYYSTDLFLPPNSVFLIAIKGKGKKTGRDIRRIAKTPIETRPLNSDPVIIVEKRGTCEYNSQLWLTCKIHAYPKPDKIIWTDSLGNILPSAGTQTKTRYDYENELVIDHLKKSETYYCSAENNLGQSTKHIDVTVKSPFIIDDRDTDSTTKVEFEGPAVLNCNIKSNYGIQINWYRIRDPLKPEIKEVIKNSDKYSILSDGTVLRINTVKADEEGKYKCIASLLDNADINQEVYQEVKINFVAPILGKREIIPVHEKKSVTITCNIKKAYPEPTITWYIKKPDTASFQPIPGNSKDLKIENADLQHTGVYKCIAHNSKGSGEQETELVVLIEPRMVLLVNNMKVTNTEVAYGSSVSLVCQVTSHTTPKIFLKDNNNEIIQPEKIETLRPFGYKSYFTIPNIKRTVSYNCEADNDIRKTKKTVAVNVKSPFEVNTPDSTTNVKYEEEATLDCDILTHFPKKMVWLRVTGKPERTEIIHNSDKYSISDDGAKLKIHKVGLDMQGKYTCKASVADDESVQAEHTTAVVITGLEIPQIQKQAFEKKVRNGTKAVLKCKISKGSPVPTINWFVKYRGNSKFEALNQSGEDLVLENSKYEDTGIYKCEANNVVGHDEQKIDLTVEGPPVIVSNEDILHSAVAGDLVLRIPCVVLGYPKPSITWSKDFKDIKLGDKYNVEDGTLVINKPLPNDSSANYTCKADNKFGTDAKTFEISIEDYIRYDQDFGNQTYIYLLEGETRKFDCYLGSKDCRWFKEGYAMNTTGPMTISNASVENHAGNYTCRTNDKLGSKSHTYIVDVGYPPKFINNNGNPTIDWNGNPRELDCSVSMQPYQRTAKMEWTYNNKASDIKSEWHKIMGWGKYTCKISNYHGEVTKTFTVVSSSYCLIKRQYEKTSPLLFDVRGKWAEIEIAGEYISMKKGTPLLLSCHNQPDKPNTFKHLSGKGEIMVTCDSEDKFLVDDKLYKFSDLQCTSQVKPIVRPTGEKCASENTETVAVGYNVDIAQNQFLELYSVCFDKDKKVPLHTKVAMQKPRNLSPIYDKDDLSAWNSNDYKEYNNGNNLGHCNSTTYCLKNGAMVNELDVRQGPAQYATYIAGLNSVPIWQDCVNNVSWSDVENGMRSRLNIRARFNMYTGAHGYTDRGDGVLVPRYLWKLIKLSSRTVYVVVRVNDPNPTEEDIFCNTTCPSWVPHDKFTYCCSLAELQRNFAVPYVI